MSSAIEKIRQELLSLYFLNSQEIDRLFGRLHNLPEKALSEILNVIKDAKSDQKNYFSKINKIDPKFSKKLEIFLEGNTDALIADSMVS